MTISHYSKLLLTLAFCVAPALSSAYYNNDFFTRIQKDETVKYWSDVDTRSFIKDSFTCEHLVSKNTKGSSFKNKNVATIFSRDWLNTETIKRPPTLVIVPPSKSVHTFLLDIKYADFTVVQDIPNGYPEAECYIIPPYKPFMYVSLYSHNITTHVYALRENDDDNNNNNNIKNTCKNFDKNMLSKCQVIGPPFSHDYPVHPFFLTGSRKVKKDDITLFTLGSLDRLERLVNLAKVWNGPMSMAIPVENTTTEIPIIFDAWISTPEMRRNVDIHLLFNDNFKSVKYSSKIFPINYLRNLALKNTRTELVMFIEGDYIIPNDFRSKIPLFKSDKKTMFSVMPLFGCKGITADKIPQTKQKVREILHDPNQTVFFDMYGYMSLDAKGWSNKSEMYQFELPEMEIIEPYYVAHRNVQLYDETYITWGFNKVTQIYDMKSVGYKIMILPDVYMVHLNHSDIKGFKNWDKGYVHDERHNLKIGTSVNRWMNFPGLLTNTHYPQWLKSNFMASEPCISPVGDHRLSELNSEIKFVGNTIGTLKTMLIGFLIALTGSIIFMLIVWYHSVK